MVSEGTKRPYYWQQYSSEEYDCVMNAILLPNLSEFRKMAYALRWWAWLSAEDSEYTDGFADLKTCYRLGRHIKGDKFLIDQLVGIAIEAITVQTAREIISWGQIDSDIFLPKAYFMWIRNFESNIMNSE